MVNAGIYLIPPFTSPFSMMETIIELNIAIVESASIENRLKSMSSICTLKFTGNIPGVEAAKDVPMEEVKCVMICKS